MNTNPNRTRDHLANERTFLAWIRTALALMGFGFVIVKFAVFIRHTALLLENDAKLPQSHSAEIGILMVFLGAVVAIMGYFSFRKTARQIDQDSYMPQFSFSLLFTILIVAMSIVLIYLLLPNIQ